MLPWRSAVWNRRLVSWLLLFFFLMLMVGPIFPTRLLAASPDPSAVEECDGCHSAETEAWQESPHAMSVSGDGDQSPVTCEGCHGSYVRGHPNDGVMQLNVDSAVCKDCHSKTSGQWEDSLHAEAGVQCIGCHLSHSQTLRLTDEALCMSCHRDTQHDAFHISHQYSDVACTNCHLAPSADPEVTTSATGETHVTIPAPDHDFVTVSGGNCVSCHREDVGAESINQDTSQMIPVKLLAIADRVPVLTAELKAAEKENRSLIATSLISLGLGTGIGSVLGIIFVLVVGYVTQRRSSR